MIDLEFVLRGYADWAWYWLSRSYRQKMKAEAKRRIEICEACEHFDKEKRICKLCGCFMDIKTKMLLPKDENGLTPDGCWGDKW